jgi:hypothetical protein
MRLIPSTVRGHPDFRILRRDTFSDGVQFSSLGEYMGSSHKLLKFLSPLCIVLFFLCSQSLFAQITSEKGAIRILLTDPQGASIGGAKVSIASKTGITQTKESSPDGSVVFPLLDPGAYDVTVESPNFKRSLLHAVAVHVTEVTNLSVVMELGEITAEVMVTGDAVQTVNTSNATLGNVLEGNVLHELPLATGNFQYLLALNAGTSSSLPDPTVAGHGDAFVFVAGQRGTANNLVIDGIDANDLGSNNFIAVPVPSQDSLEEFRVQTSLYDASQGKTSGGNIDVLTRGGTSAYHGEAYEFFRNDDLNANLFFFNSAGSPRPELKQNQFGGNFGGPVPAVTPILKDTYFFGSYQGTRQINGVASAISADIPVYPAQRTAANIEQEFGIPSVDPTALALLNAPGPFGGFLVPSATPTPGCVGVACTFGLFTVSEPLTFNEDKFDINFDRNIGSRNKISERFFWDNLTLIDPLGGEDPGGFGSGQSNPQDNRLISLAWTYIISPTLVNEARFGFNRINFSNVPKVPATLSSIGMTRFNSAQFPDIPLFFTDDFGEEFGGISTNNDQAETANTFHLADTLSWTHGKHSFRFGGEMRRYQINLFNNFASRGVTEFASTPDFLQGNVEVAFVGTGITDRGFRARDVSGYFQDDWKVSKRLTLNLGVRYDYMGPSTDVKDRLGNFDSSLLSTATKQNGGDGLLDGFVLPAGANFGAIQGTPGVSNSTLFSSSPHNFSPRVGLAWDPFGDGKTAVRAGYGLYYIRISNQTLLQLITSSPFFQLSNVLFPGTPLSNPFPNLPTSSQFPQFPPTPAFTGFDAGGNPMFSNNLLTLNPFVRTMVTPYSGNWNFTIQRDLPWHFSIETGYIGSEGVHLLDGQQVNQALLANAANPITVGGLNGVPQTIITDNTLANTAARVGIIGFSPQGLNTVTENGHSSYNAFVFTLKRQVGNLFFQGAYTFSKSIDNQSGNLAEEQDLGATTGNQLDLRTARGLSDFDRTHRLQVTYTYNIPGPRTGLLGHVFGNWSMGGLTTFQSGLPVTFTCSNCAQNLLGLPPSSTFPEVIGNLNDLMKSGSPESFTNTSVFNAGIIGTTPLITGPTTVSGLNIFGGTGNQSFVVGGDCSTANPCALLGNLGRNIPQARGPWQQDWDWFVSKKIPINEKLNLTFRSEFFNIFNHPNFAITNTDIGSPAFGQYASTVGGPRVIQFALKLQF